MTTPRAAIQRGVALVLGLVLTAVVGVLAGTVVTTTTRIPGLPDPGAAIRFGLPVARLLFDVAGVAALGLTVLPLLLRQERARDSEPVLARGRRAAVVVGAGWTASALLLLWFQARELTAGALDLTTITNYALQVSAGRAVLVTGGCALVLTALGMFTLRLGEQIPAEARLIVALLGVLPLPLTGHASTTRQHTVATLSMGLHVTAAAAWVGGLGAVVVLVAGRRSLLASVLPRYSRLAAACLLTVAASGTVNALVVLGGEPGLSLPGALVSTRYGWLVLGKTACLLALAALGGWIRRRLLPMIAQHRPAPLFWLAASELMVMMLAIGLAAVLARAPVT